MAPTLTPEIPEGTPCAGGLQRGGTKIVPCHNGPDDGPAPATVIRTTDGRPVCKKHGAGALAIRPGGAFNDNGKIQCIYLRMDGSTRWKVGRSSDPDTRNLPGQIVGTPVRLAPDGVAPNAITAEAVEHATRLLLARRLGGRLGVSTKEWVHVAGVDAHDVRELFDQALDDVLHLLDVRRLT